MDTTTSFTKNTFLCDEPQSAVERGTDAPQSIERKLGILHRGQYPQLDRDEFELFMAICEERKLSAWSRHLIPEMQTIDGRRELKLITTIDAFRLIAARTGRYGGWKGPLYFTEDGEWRDVLPRNEIPVAAKFGVRYVDSKRVLWRSARWDSYAPVIDTVRGQPIYPDHWVKMPDVMISKCAEALSLRAAFPHELAGLYTTDEMEQSRRRKPRPLPSDHESDAIADPVAGIDAPTSRFQLELRMVDLGMTNPSRRALLIESFRPKYGHLDEEGFCAKVYGELMKKPALYGLAALKP